MGLLSRIRHWFIESERNYNKFWTGQMEPCPICGHKAALIHYCGENNPEFWMVECGDFDDDGGWNMSGKCHFMDSLFHDEYPKFYTIKGAVLYWNNTVVPIGNAARIAMQRMQDYKEGKRKRFDLKGVTLPPFVKEEESKNGQ